MDRAGGIDAWRRGWVLALVGPDTSSASEVLTAGSVVDLLHRCRTAKVSAVGIDMPIGFAVDANRVSERLARARLGRRACTLFPTPAHAVLGVDDWPEALALNRQLVGKGFSKQAFHLLRRCREVRAAVTPADQPWCSEVHPELSFAAMNGGEPLPSKHGVQGRDRRIDLITTLVAADAGDHIAVSDAPAVDVLDAYAAAWTAARLGRGAAEVLGGGSDPDGYSLTITV